MQGLTQRASTRNFSLTRSPGRISYGEKENGYRVPMPVVLQRSLHALLETSAKVVNAYEWTISVLLKN